jgi:hypothetical protein
MSLVRAVSGTLLPLLRAGGSGGLFEVALYCTHRPRGGSGGGGSGSGSDATSGGQGGSSDDLDVEPEEDSEFTEEAGGGSDARSGLLGAGLRSFLGRNSGRESLQAGALQPVTRLPEVDPVEVGWTDEVAAAAVESIVVGGRPNLDVIFREECAQARLRSELGRADALEAHAVAMVCGPEPMMREVARLSLRERMDFRGETFHF